MLAAWRRSNSASLSRVANVENIDCRPRRNGSTQPVEPMVESIRGGTTMGAEIWPTLPIEIRFSPGVIETSTTDIRRARRLEHFHSAQAPLEWKTWLETSGNGAWTILKDIGAAQKLTRGVQPTEPSVFIEGVAGSHDSTACARRLADQIWPTTRATTLAFGLFASASNAEVPRRTS